VTMDAASPSPPPAEGPETVGPCGRARPVTPITTDDKVEITATLLGSFVLGASFARDFLLHGKFEIRVFFLGISCFVLFIMVALIAKIRVRAFDRSKLALSLTWALVFSAGNIAAIDLFSQQFLAAQLAGDIQLETILFLLCYGLATNLLFLLNRAVLVAALQQKTIYKYILAPINGLSGGTVVVSLIVWMSR